MRTFRLLLVVSLALAALPACHRWWDHHHDGDEEQVYRDPADEIRVHVLDRFVIALDSNASTGYSWRLARHPEPDVAVMLDNHYDPGDGHGAVGAPGVEHWRFLAVGHGATEIEMEYVRPWEHERPARTAVFRVRVR